MKKISRRNFLKTCAIAGSAAALTGLRRLFQHDFWQRRKYLRFRFQRPADHYFLSP